MVIALVLVPALSEAFTGPTGESQVSVRALATAIVLTLGKIGMFIALMLIIGRRLIPWTLNMVSKAASRELFTLAILTIALGVAFGSAELFNASFALGAFFAGLILSESKISHKVAAIPFR